MKMQLRMRPPAQCRKRTELVRACSFLNDTLEILSDSTGFYSEVGQKLNLDEIYFGDGSSLVSFTRWTALDVTWSIGDGNPISNCESSR